MQISSDLGDMEALKERIATLLTPSRTLTVARRQVEDLATAFATKAVDSLPSANSHRQAVWWSRNAAEVLREGRLHPERDVANGVYLLENATVVLLDQIIGAASRLREPRRSALLGVAQGGGADLLSDLVRVRMLGLGDQAVLACEEALRSGRFPLPTRSLFVGGAEVGLL